MYFCVNEFALLCIYSISHLKLSSFYLHVFYILRMNYLDMKGFKIDKIAASYDIIMLNSYNLYAFNGICDAMYIWFVILHVMPFLITLLNKA